MSTKNKLRPVRVGLISLGCAKNLVDGETILGSLLKAGLEITNDASQADAVIVNTCSFIDAAQQESVDAILQAAELRARSNPTQALIVAGCLSQRFRTELPKLLPEVDAFMGIDQIASAAAIVRQIVEKRRSARSVPQASRNPNPKLQAPLPTPVLVDVNERPAYIADYATPRFRLTPKHFAYVKIADGCNHPCSYCIIPRIRGRHRSRPQSDVVREAKELLSQGVKELNLISQDSTYYGADLRRSTEPLGTPAPKVHARRGGPSLASLVRELDVLKGDFWIRLLYTHPAHWTDELIDAIADSRKVARYIDIPLQHIDEAMLERMRRETSRQHIEELLCKIRDRIPGIAIRTTFIVGFPGETETRFQNLLKFIREARFERLGVFAYSQEEGTRAAKMDNQVPARIRKERQKRAMAEQLKVARSISASCVGREIKVLVEGAAGTGMLEKAKVLSWEKKLIRGSHQGLTADPTWLVARGEADAPDIDGRVYVRSKRAPVGQFASVKVVGHTDYDLIAEVV